ncbi:hypothetical protein ABL78_3238 [Leptomonas seymouri]|uniref:Uncharacterized protein n=1 Tax=Leptomonas seymouri TaxID=5684 RepID=A0A0N1ILG2_LEPSE|nr:hypothetical protein ABL78_3238 [Leptomonas seymouri]|eukprot:KPI87700.1 hypothetical protein ABL78_3238 [Leptomonas seymouri]
MSSDSPELSALMQLRSLARARPGISRPFALGNSTSPGYVSVSTFSFHDDAVIVVTPHELNRRVNTPTPPATRHQEWASECRKLTAADNGRRGCSRVSTATAQVRSCSVELPSTRKARLLPATEARPAELRQTRTPLPMMMSAVTELSFSTFSDDATDSSATSLSATQPGRVSSFHDSGNSPTGNAEDTHRASESALEDDLSTSPQEHRIFAMMGGPPRVACANRVTTPLPPLPSSTVSKAPSALATPPSARSSVLLSSNRSPSKFGEVLRPPRSMSPLEGYSSVRAPHKPQRWLEGGEFDDGTPTSTEREELPEDCVSGVGAAPPAQRGKRVGRGFNRRGRDMDPGEPIAPHATLNDRHRLACTANDLTCNTSSPGLLGGHSSAIERNRRSSISFNNEVSVADADELTVADLHHLCDTPYNQSVAQPQPPSLVDASFPTLSSTTIFKRDGVTYII